MRLHRAIIAVFFLLAQVCAVAGVAFPAAADSVREAQWQLEFLRAAEAWPHSTGAGQIVAVIDSGVDAAHPDLSGQVLAGADFVDGTTDGRTDTVGHGTTIAGLIAGSDDDENGAVGLAPDASILPVRVLDANNQYESANNVAEAIRWATDHGATVINASLGSAESSEALTQALRYAFKHDVVVVACNGNVSNERGGEVWHPAREEGVIAVSGVTRNGGIWEGSLTGEATVLAAPAVEITGAHAGGGYALNQGTSFAAPLVAASVALVRSAFPDMDAGNIINRLISTAWDFGDAGFDPVYGYGIVNPARALTAEVGSVSVNPLLPGVYRAGGNASGEPRSPGLAENEPSGRNQQIDMAVTLGSAAVATVAVVVLIIAALTMRRGAHRPSSPQDTAER